MIINIFVAINQINKQKAKTYNHYTIPKLLEKNFLTFFFFTEYQNEWTEHKIKQ